MALKPILSVEVNDEQFKSFAALFDKYKAAVEATPGEWAKISAGIEGAKDSFGDFGERVGKLEEELRKLGAQKVTTSDDDQRSAGFWGSISTAAKSVGGHIADATGSLLKWSVVTSAFSGLIGGGALFGLDRLAGSVAGQRRSALGLGVGYGEQSSFNNNMSRFVNAPSLLGGVANAKYDYQSPAYLAMIQAGISPQDIRSKSPADLGIEYLRKIRGIVGAYPEKSGLRGPIARAYGTDALVPQDDLRRYLNADPKEIEAQESQYRKQAESQNLSGDAQRAWQDFSTALERASVSVETSFARALEKLGGSLTSLTAAVTDTVSAFLQSDTFKRWIDDMAVAIGKFADWVGSPQFEEDVTGFVHKVGEFADNLSKMVGGIQGVITAANNVAHVLNKMVGINDDAQTVAQGMPVTDYGGGGIHSPQDAADRAGGAVPQVASKATDKTIPAEGRAFIDTIASTESRGEYNILNGGGHFSSYDKFPEGGKAAGRYQFLPSTWREEANKLGLKDFSPKSQDIAAWDYAQQQYKRLTGNDMLEDLKADKEADVARALAGTWLGLSGKSSLAIIGRYRDKLKEESEAKAPEAPLAIIDRFTPKLKEEQPQKPDDAPPRPASPTPAPAIPPNWFSRDPNAAHMSGDSGTDFSHVGRPAETGTIGPTSPARSPKFIINQHSKTQMDDFGDDDDDAPVPARNPFRSSSRPVSDSPSGAWNTAPPKSKVTLHLNSGNNPAISFASLASPTAPVTT